MENQIQYFIFIALMTMFSAFSQDKVTLSGTIANKSNNETLIGVNIIIPEANASITTNSYGFYSITLPKGDYTIIISYMGFDNIEEPILLIENTKKIFGCLKTVNHWMK